jgi:hypothetical protein
MECERRSMTGGGTCYVCEGEGACRNLLCIQVADGVAVEAYLLGSIEPRGHRMFQRVERVVERELLRSAVEECALLVALHPAPVERRSPCSIVHIWLVSVRPNLARMRVRVRVRTSMSVRMSFAEGLSFAEGNGVHKP